LSSNPATNSITPPSDRFTKEYTLRPLPIGKISQDTQDFLEFMEGQVRENPIWVGASQAEIENAMEGIEKSLLNKLYDL